jgi:hypothetical protein
MGGMRRQPKKRRASPLFAVLMLIASGGFFLACLGTVAMVEELRYGPSGRVAQFYRRTGIDDVLGLASDAISWLIGVPL